MKTLALDIGDRWTGVSISDPLGMIARPYDTVKTTELTAFLVNTLKVENISTIVVGLPRTMRGTESEQTIKTKKMAKELEQTFGTTTWALWDERLTSKQANKIKKAKTKEEKLRSHAIAAALILSSYLEYKRLQKQS